MGLALLLAGFSDWADGWLVRRSGGGSFWGARLDPLTPPRSCDHRPPGSGWPGKEACPSVSTVMQKVLTATRSSSDRDRPVAGWRQELGITEPADHEPYGLGITVPA